MATVEYDYVINSILLHDKCLYSSIDDYKL